MATCMVDGVKVVWGNIVGRGGINTRLKPPASLHKDRGFRSLFVSSCMCHLADHLKGLELVAECCFVQFPHVGVFGAFPHPGDAPLASNIEDKLGVLV